MSYPQGNFYPQTSPYPQSSFYPSGSIGYPQGPVGYPQGIFGGYPQQQLGLAHGPAQFGQSGQFGQPTPFGQPQFGTAGTNGMTNGALSTASLSLQPQHQLLLQLAQYHHWVAQQFTQLAALQGIHNPAGPYAGQFIPGQMAANFVPGITMH